MDSVSVRILGPEAEGLSIAFEVDYGLRPTTYKGVLR